MPIHNDTMMMRDGSSDGGQALVVKHRAFNAKKKVQVLRPLLIFFVYNRVVNY